MENGKKNKPYKGEDGLNIFHGNFKQYLHDKMMAEQKGIDLGK
jgi:hypothetical protein